MNAYTNNSILIARLDRSTNDWSIVLEKAAYEQYEKFRTYARIAYPNYTDLQEDKALFCERLGFSVICRLILKTRIERDSQWALILYNDVKHSQKTLIIDEEEWGYTRLRHRSFLDKMDLPLHDFDSIADTDRFLIRAGSKISDFLPE